VIFVGRRAQTPRRVGGGEALRSGQDHGAQQIVCTAVSLKFGFDVPLAVQLTLEGAFGT
jgi:hypothetical protein